MKCPHLRCLANEKYKKKRCVKTSGELTTCDDTDPCMIEYMEPDLFKCEQIPFYCDDRDVIKGECLSR